MAFEQKREELEEYGIVLDYMPSGKSFSVKAEPIVQIVGEAKFTLLEAILKPGVSCSVGERAYIGKGERDKVALIKTRLAYNELTEGAKRELQIAVGTIIKGNEARFVNIFNSAGPLNIREHSLELLPGVGKRHLKAILEARSQKPFDNFADISARVQLLQDPIKLLTERILIELKGESRFYILTRPFSRM